MTNQATETLYTKSFFTSKEYNLSNADQLRISEASAVSAKTESIPLDLIEQKPVTEEKINPQLIGFTLTCALASGIFYTLFVSTELLVASVFSGLFLIATLGAMYLTNKMKLRSYTYHYANTTTPLFTLNSDQSNDEETSQFVKTLSNFIQISNSQPEEPVAQVITDPNEEKSVSDQEQEYLAYTYHLDFLYASGFVDESSYQQIGNSISEKVFNEIEIEVAGSNVIPFPSKS